MKKTILAVGAACVLLCGSVSAQEYCTPTGSHHPTQKTFIKKAFTTGAVVDLLYPATGEISEQPTPVFNYLSETTMTVTPGSTFTLTVNGSDDLLWNVAEIYVDWNGDKDFEDTGEYIGEIGTDANGSGNQNVKTIVKAITVPDNATAGDTRMRIKYLDSWHTNGATDMGGADGGKHNNPCGFVPKAICYDLNLTIGAGIPVERTISVNTPHELMGSVEILTPPNGENNGYMSGSEVTVKAISSPGYHFLNWTDSNGSVVSTDAEYTFAVGGNIVLTANFSDSYCKPAITERKNTGWFNGLVTTGALTNLSYSEMALPSFTYKLLDDEVVIERGKTFTLDVNPTNTGWGYTRIYFDANSDGDFEDAGELLGTHGDADFDGYKEYPAFTQGVAVPSDIPLGLTRIRYMFAPRDAEKTPCASQREGSCYDILVKVIESKPMELSSVEADLFSMQATVGKKDFVLLKVNVETDGTQEPFTVSSLKYTLSGTLEMQFLKNLRVVYSGSDGNPGNNMFAQTDAAGEIIFTGEQILSSGNNFFWLLADIADNAKVGSTIVPECVYATVDGNNELVSNPGGTITVVPRVVDYTEGLSVWFNTPNDLSGKEIWNMSSGDSSSNPDVTWEQKSFPVGNGSFGGNILGSVATERITLNEKSLWKGGPNTSGGAAHYWDANKEGYRVLDQIRSSFAQSSGSNSTATSLTQNNFNGKCGYEPNSESPFRFGSFTTMGEFQIETGINESTIGDYRRILSLDSALVVVQFNSNGTQFRRKFFSSYPDNVMVYRFESGEPGLQNLTFRYAANPQATGSVTADGVDGIIYNGRLNNNNMQFVIRVRVVAENGAVVVENGAIKVTGADNVTFYVTGDTDYKMNYDPDFSDNLAYVGVDPEATTLASLDLALAKGYDAVYNAHRADYSNLFDRVKINLNTDKNIADIPTDQRLTKYRNGTLDNYLEELYYQFGRYLLIASSRPGNLPANLQGFWHNNIEGPWRVDYHNNINLQMNYWPACPTNLSECQWPLIDYIRTLVKPGERTAKAYYGPATRGWTASVSANIFGFTSPLSSTDMSWNFSFVAGPWLATHIWEYYDYTRDKEFLQTTGYDLIKSSAEFAVDHLWRKSDGSYAAAPSTSPEHGPIDQGTTFAHAVVREILMDAIKASEALDVDASERAEWQNVIDKLMPYKIGRYGQLMEWSTDIDSPTDDHRHVNHLFGLHPGHTISPITTPELSAASKIVLEKRGDGATGWSMGWKLNQWARLHDGNHAYVLFQNLLKNGTADNLWDMHPPFQIDGNFGGTAGVTEMLMQSHMGFIHLLPALPDGWSSGNIQGLCAKGNFEIDINWAGNLLDKAVIRSKSGESCTVRYKDAVKTFDTTKEGVYVVTFDGTALLVSEDYPEKVSDNTVAENNLKVIPNPNGGDFTAALRCPETGNVRIDIHNMKGQNIMRLDVLKNSSKLELPVQLNDVDKGKFYVIMAQINGSKYSSRFWVK